jgi:hypothetical protein
MEKEILSHGQLLMLAWLGNGVLLGIAVGILGKMIANLRDYMRETCSIKHENVDKAIEALTKEDQELWDAFNVHGHMGLTGENGKVTRG